MSGEPGNDELLERLLHAGGMEAAAAASRLSQRLGLEELDRRLIAKRYRNEQPITAAERR